MKAKIKILKEVNVKSLHVYAKVRYWEDSEVNGQSDENGYLIPFREGEIWEPIIDLDKGKIIDWPIGTTANIHYKVCDAGSYMLFDDQGYFICEIRDGYVPRIMCPDEPGYGDYIIMQIDENGFIDNFTVDLEGFPGFEEEN